MIVGLPREVVRASNLKLDFVQDLLGVHVYRLQRKVGRAERLLNRLWVGMGAVSRLLFVVWYSVEANVFASGNHYLCSTLYERMAREETIDSLREKGRTHNKPE